MASVALVAACAPKPLILQGPRFDPRTPLDQVMADVGKGNGDMDGGPQPNRAEPLRLPAPIDNSEWTARNGGPQHRITQPALGSHLTEIWEAKIGSGDDARHAITATPVVAGGRVFALDSRATVTAVSTSGAPLWSRDLTPPSDSPNDASGGGLAYGAGRVYVTSGFGELVALDAASGAVVWRQRFHAPVTGTPTIEGNVVYVTAADATGWAIDAATGKVRWQVQGTPGQGGVTGGAGPALGDRFAFMPFNSGQLIGVIKPGGTQVWSTTVAGERLGQGYSSLNSISGDPVVVGNTIYVGNAGGRVMALDTNTGNPIWTANDGVVGPVWPAGNALFLVNDQAKLVRLDAATGAQVWAMPLPYFVPVKKEKKRRDIFAHYGPVLAGNRLIVVSSDGQIRSFDPSSGALLGAVPMPSGAASGAVVAGRTLYVVTEDGKLRAFR